MEVTVNIRKSLLVRRALERHRIITPCSKHPFTVLAGSLTFWYNDRDGSTHIVQERKRAA